MSAQLDDALVPAGSVAREDLWRAHAACRGAGPDRWFEERGGQAREALEVCARCPVRADCLQESLLGGSVFYVHGVWGGASELTRRGLLRELMVCPHRDRAFAVDGCGCGFCRRVAAHERRMERVAAGRAGVPLNMNGPGASHGKASTYGKGCRCGPCTDAMREQRAALRERRRRDDVASVGR